MTRASRNLLSPDSCRDNKFGKFPRSQSTLLLSKKRAHDATIIRPDKFKEEPNATIGKSRRMYHGKIPQYWKRAGHDTRVMHHLRESSNATDASKTDIRDSSVASDKTATDAKKSSKKAGLNFPNPTSQQKGLLRQLTKDSADVTFEPKQDMTRAKSAFKMPVMTAAQKLAAERARRAKSNSPATNKEGEVEPQFLEVKKRLKTPFEVVETEVNEPVPEPPPSVKRVSKASNLSPIAGTPSKLSEKNNEDDDNLSLSEKVASAMTTKAKTKDKDKDKDKDKEKSKSKTKEKLKEATTIRGRLKLAVSSGKNEKEKEKKDRDKSTTREKSVESAGKKKGTLTKTKSQEKKGAISKQKSIEKKSAKSGRNSGKDRDSGKERSTTREKSGKRSASKDRLGVSDRSSAKSVRGKSGRSSAGKDRDKKKDKDKDKDKDKEKKKDGKFKEKGSLIKNLGFLRSKKKPEKEKSKSASSSSGKSQSGRSRKSTAVERKGPKLKLQKSTSAGTLKSQDSVEMKKEIELNKSASFRMNRKDLTSALSNRLKSAISRQPSGDSSNSSRSSSLFSLTRMKAITHNKANQIRKTVKHRRLEQEIAEEEARKSGRRLEKIDSKESVVSQATAGPDNQSVTSKKTNASGSSTSLKRLKIGTAGGMSTNFIAASASNLTGTVTDYFDQKEGGKNKTNIEDNNEGASVTDNVILEKLKSIQRTVSDAADEIQKAIDENLTDLQTLEKGPSVPPSARSKVSGRTDDGVKTTSSRIVSQKSFENESNNNNNNSVNLIDVENNNVIPMASSYEKVDEMKTTLSRIDVQSDKLSMKADMDKIERVGSTKMTPMAGPSTSHMNMSG